MARPAEFELAAPAGAGERFRIIEVVDDDQVEPAVAVEIEEGRRRGPERIIEARLAGDFEESPLALVEEEPRGTEFGQQQIGQPVVVDVSDGDPHAEASHVEPATGRDVAEGAVGFLVEELIFARPGSAVVNEIDVELPVAIEIEKGAARSRDVRHEIIRYVRPAIVGVFQTKLLRDVFEPRRLGQDGRVGHLRATIAARGEDQEDDDNLGSCKDHEPSFPPRRLW